MATAAVLATVATVLAVRCNDLRSGRQPATLCALQQTEETESPATTATSPAQRAITECDRRITRHQAALDAGADPQLVATWINQAQAEKASARQDLLATTTAQPEALTTEQITHMVSELGP
ncbi:hypothetical protein ACH4TE_26320 [Streptomyces sioyaensis]|uniref:hypothetical protein n=1 Tax=Streptomyces sioyaensis TaxID=67364 RepID=UPI00379A50CB